jgi:phospholipid/cholesterol/gamma-HCH transport system permease protein
MRTIGGPRIKTPLYLMPFFILGTELINTTSGLRFFSKYLFEVFYALVTPPFRVREFVTQLYLIGVQSAPVIIFSVSFAAAVTILEYAYHMNLVIHSITLVPGFAALLILRELGAVITALLLTSRVGAGITAEIGSMQITEQIDALKLLNVEPVRYLVIPRLLATICSIMALVVFANATCLFFSMIMSIKYLSYSVASFITAMNRFASFKDLALSIVKAAVFGTVIPLTSCFYGFQCKSGAEGVGRATTKSVVTNAVSIIILDFILTYLFSYLY